MVPASNDLSFQPHPPAPAGSAKTLPQSLRERLNRFWSRLRQYG